MRGRKEREICKRNENGDLVFEPWWVCLSPSRTAVIMVFNMAVSYDLGAEHRPALEEEAIEGCLTSSWVGSRRLPTAGRCRDL